MFKHRISKVITLLVMAVAVSVFAGVCISGNKVTVGGTDKTINVSPMTYVYKVLSGDYSGRLKNLVMSLYNLYNRSNGN